MYLIEKIIGYFLGFILSLVPQPIFKKMMGGIDTIIGVDVANFESDQEVVLELGAKIVRVNYREEEMKTIISFLVKNGIDYYIQIGQGENTDEMNAKEIRKCHNEIREEKQPLFYALVNEDNDYTYERVLNTASILNLPNVIITKGSYTSITESAGLKIYFNKKMDTELPHLIHFYLKPIDGSSSNFLENLLRKSMLHYLMFKLRLKGMEMSNVIVSESHDGTNNKIIIIPRKEKRYLLTINGRYDGDLILKKLANDMLEVRRYEGDMVFATKEGWHQLVNLADRFGFKAILYYQAPYLRYNGNTVIK